jgi:hypothetical protein
VKKKRSMGHSNYYKKDKKEAFVHSEHSSSARNAAEGQNVE